MSVLGENANGNVPDVDDADLWASELGLTYPVLADTDGQFFPVWDPDGVLPMATIIDQDGIIVWMEAGGTSGLDEIEATVVELLDR